MNNSFSSLEISESRPHTEHPVFKNGEDFNDKEGRSLNSVNSDSSSENDDRIPFQSPPLPRGSLDDKSSPFLFFLFPLLGELGMEVFSLTLGVHSLLERSELMGIGALLGLSIWGLYSFIRHQKHPDWQQNFFISPLNFLFIFLVGCAIGTRFLLKGGVDYFGLTELPLSPAYEGMSLFGGAVIGIVLWIAGRRWQKGLINFSTDDLHRNLSPVLFLTLPLAGAGFFMLLIGQPFLKDTMNLSVSVGPLSVLIGGLIGLSLWAIYHRLSHGPEAFHQTTVFSVNTSPLILFILSVAGSITFYAIGKLYFNHCLLNDSLPGAPLGDMVSLIFGAVVGATLWIGSQYWMDGAESFNTRTLFFGKRRLPSLPEAVGNKLGSDSPDSDGMLGPGGLDLRRS